MDDYGVKVSREGADVLSAEGIDVLLNTTHPHAKMDTQNPVSFKNIEITFNNDPPTPAPETFNETTVYAFQHGYDYIPSFWAIFNVYGTPTDSGTSILRSFGQDELAFAVGDGAEAVVGVKADKQNVYVYIIKYGGDFLFGPSPDIRGIKINVRTFVFIESLQYPIS